MTKSWTQCKEEAGLTDDLSDQPVLEYHCFAYKNGVSHGPFNNLISAKAISHNVEKLPTPETKKAHDAYWKDRKQKESNAIDIWYKSLREYYSDLTDGAFDIIYQKSYDESHSYGYDEVSATFGNNYQFYLDLLKVMK